MNVEPPTKTDTCKVLNALTSYLLMWSHFNTKQELAQGIISELERHGVIGIRYDRLKHQFTEGD